jgi:hypothetical protein
MEIASSRVVGLAGAALVAASVVGGAVSVAAGVNTWSTAWTSEATLAAPWPMLLIQAAATAAAVQRRSGVALAGATVLGLSAAVAGVSGFFDGQLGRSDLGLGYVIAQVGYLVVAWATVVCAAYRVRAVLAAGSRTADW